MAEELKHVENPWMAPAGQSLMMSKCEKNLSLMCGSTVDINGIEMSSTPQHRSHNLDLSSQSKLGLTERAFFTTGASFLSAILVNPLDVAKTRLQAQAAEVAYSHPLSNFTTRMALFGPHMVLKAAQLRGQTHCAVTASCSTLTLKTLVID